MLTPIANIHRSKLPALGTIVIVKMRELVPGHRYRRYIVESFPLCNSADQRYSRGIHCCTIRALDNGHRQSIAGHWCDEVSQ